MKPVLLDFLLCFHKLALHGAQGSGNGMHKGSRYAKGFQLKRDAEVPCSINLSKAQNKMSTTYLK